ncbi:glycosyltransferase family 2 protein [Nitrosomonas supralitoralis]|uniref:glycosyltransferase family 2 protein n=1 Tax=Nitrosomonas supralitoralis TaxID=2116706 RepID=UPI0015594A22|nr:glycosyltransferase family 2 protein [Nitrosomonas supralitoralis]
MVSVLIVNYFSFALTVRAIRSVLSDLPSAQIIVVENSDDAVEAMSLLAILPRGVKLIVAQSNLGFGRACNLALNYSHGEWIFLLNPDAIVLPGCLEKLIETLQCHPHAGAVSPVAQWDQAATFLLPPGQMQSPTWEWMLSLGERVPPIGRRLSKSFRKWALQCLYAANPVSQRMLSGGHMLLSRQAINESGGLFDPSFFMYYEDTDLCRRLLAAGFQLLIDPRARVVHEWRNDPGKNRFVPDSRRRYLEKHFPHTWFTDRCRLKLEQSWPTRPINQNLLNLGACASPPSFELPADQNGDWLLELSLNPLFIPAAYSKDSAPPSISPHVGALLGPGQYWARVTSSSEKERLFTWKIPNHLS